VASKISKKDADYIPAREYLGVEFCKECTMWRGPDGCSSVAGDIESNAHCRLYKYSGGKFPTKE
jgi:hypothetical protein